MKIAIPMANGQLCMHFGHCEQFAIVDADKESKKINSIDYQTPPPHEPGVIPRWINSLGINTVIAGGMGPMAQQMMEAQGIQVLTGAPCLPPEELVKAYFDSTLALGDNVCNHDAEGHGHGGQHNCHGHN